MRAWLEAVLTVPVLGGVAMALTLGSPAFPPNGEIPPVHTCEGADTSPPLAWSGAPAGTKSFALVVDDPDAPDPAAPKQTWVHWVVFDLPATTTSLHLWVVKRSLCAVSAMFPPSERIMP